MDDFAKVDNILAMSQTDIGESSNLAQIAQTYDCTFNDEKYADFFNIVTEARSMELAVNPLTLMFVLTKNIYLVKN